MRAEQVFNYALEGADYEYVNSEIITGSNIAEEILNYAAGPTLEEAYDLIVIGATDEPLFRNLLVGNMSEKIAKEARVTVVVVKRRSSPLHSILRQTVLEPSSNGAI
jgi:nucleotide-binding universal stress UspA family protein